MLSLKVLNKEGNTQFVKATEDEVVLVVTSQYQEGDEIVLETSHKNSYMVVQMDDAMDAAFVYVTGDVHYKIPFGEKRICYSPKAFCGTRHYIYARLAREDEINSYRNLAKNVFDQHGDTHCYPHATANVETRGESVFAARNAIDGIVANASHGEWPYESWGINQRADAKMKVDFGRAVEVDQVVLYTRADFPHDSWWECVTLKFSDGSNIEWKLEKSSKPHIITFEKKVITWVELDNLIKADDLSPFPALTQMEVYGTNALKGK
ncbi:MAG: carbohydrate-binding protein [Velocimicrobium sp.]